MAEAQLSNGVIVFVTPDVRRTATYYRDVLGFRIVEHYDKEEPFAALYRDAVEIVIVQAKYGEVVPNRIRYGLSSPATSGIGGVRSIDLSVNGLALCAVTPGDRS